MACVNGSPRFETVLLTMDREGSGRYSVRHPVDSRSASAAERARPIRGDWRMGKRVSIFAFYSPFERVRPALSGVKWGFCGRLGAAARAEVARGLRPSFCAVFTARLRSSQRGGILGRIPRSRAPVTKRDESRFAVLSP